MPLNERDQRTQPGRGRYSCDRRHGRHVNPGYPVKRESGSACVRTDLDIQPQTEPEVVRQALHTLSFRLVDEAFVEDRGKTYVIVKAVHGEEQFLDFFTYRYGRILVEKKDPGYLAWLARRAQHLRDWSSKATDPEEQKKLAEEASFIESLLR